MPTFTYTARDAAGQRVTGQLAGASEAAVLGELQSRRLAPVSVTELVEKSTRRKVSVRVLATAYRQLSDLLEAGVPILRSIRILGRSKSNPQLAEVMAQIADEVADGTALADAMAAFPEIFPAVHVAMVRAGEKGGFLEDVLQRLGKFLEWQAEMRAKVIGNLVYPAVLAAVMIGVIIFALVGLVPKFKTFFTNADMPAATKLLMGLSDLLVERWGLLIVLLVILVGFLGWARSQPGVRRHLALAVLKTPKIGTLVRDLAVARFARMLGTLLENGINMLAALQISKDATGHVLLSDAIAEATESVRAGESLAEPLGASGLLEEDTVEVVSVGETANNLPDVLSNLADTLEKRADRQLVAAVRLMEPAMLLVMGGVVFFLFLALVVPMLQMTANV